MRRFFPPTALVLATLALGSAFPAAAAEGSSPDPYNLVLEGDLPDATLLTVGYEGKEAKPIELTMVGGKVQNGLSIPAAKGNRVVLIAQNADGKVLYEGSLEIDVGVEFTPQVSVEMKSALDGSPGELTLASHRVSVDFAAVEREGKSFTRVTADVFDANGQRLEVKGDELAWDIDDPWLRENLRPCPKGSGHSVCAEFEPYKPDGNRIALNACFRGGICRMEFVPPIARVWALVTVGSANHTCALKRDGTAYCWGLGEQGQLGYVAPKDCAQVAGPGGSKNLGCSGFPNPVVCPNGLCQFTDLSAGRHHTCAVDTNGEAWCWGSNSFGELGIGTQTPGTAVPTLVSTPYRFTAIRAGTGITCGLTTTAKVACWGDNASAIVPANLGWYVTRPEIVDVPTRAGITAIDATVNHACAKTGSGQLYCWGSNAESAIGSDQFTAAPHCGICPAAPRLMQTDISALVMKRVNLVSTGSRATCAHLTTSETACWGRPLPQWFPAPFERLSVGEKHYCAIAGGVLGCAGNGALGDGLDKSSDYGPGRGPVAMAGKHRNYREVDTGFNTTCAIGHDEQIYCWGHNEFGALGLGLSEFGSPGVLEPTPVLFLQSLNVPPPHRYP